MTTRITLYTTQADFEALHELADTKKRMLRIGRQELSDLLMDHSTMLQAIKGCGIVVGDAERAA